MRRIRLQARETKIWKRWIRDCEAKTVEVVEAIERGENVEYEKKLYGRKSLRQSYFFAREEPFHGKCAYCEAPISDFSHGNIDHFRPKGRVRDAENRTVHLLDEEGRPRRDENGILELHPGYYWLAYDWRNLLPTCDKCNQSNRIGDKVIGKHDRFPVEGRHAQTPEEIADERPLLLHPGSQDEEDDPRRHLDVDPKKGLLVAKTPRGEACIEIFGLNIRDQLVQERKRACRAVEGLIVRISQPGTALDPEDLLEIRQILAGRRPYSLVQELILRRYLNEKLGPLKGAIEEGLE